MIIFILKMCGRTTMYGADLEKRFIESPAEIKKSNQKKFPASQELQASAM
jgi:hypothetical protein